MYDMILKDKSIDVVNASRWLENSFLIKNYGFFSSLFNKLFQKMCQIFFNSNMTDFTPGYRLLKTSILKKYKFKFVDQSFSLESGIILALDKIKIIEISWNWKKRQEGRSQNTFFKKSKYLKVLFYYFFYKKLF